MTYDEIANELKRGDLTPFEATALVSGAYLAHRISKEEAVALMDLALAPQAINAPGGAS